MYNQDKAQQLFRDSGLTLKEVGRRMNPDDPVDITRVNNFLRREYSGPGPTIGNLVDLSRGLGCSIFDLLDDWVLEEQLPAIQQSIGRMKKSKRKRAKAAA